MGITGDGRIWVLDGAAPHVRVFDAGGRSVRAFGRDGRGPDEFVAPESLGVLRNGGVEILDVRTMRRTLIDSAGHSTGDAPLTDFPIHVGTALDDGLTILATTDFRSPTLAVKRWPAGGAMQGLLRFTPDFPRSEKDAPSQFVALASAPNGTFAVGDGTGTYHIRIYDRDGKPVRDIERRIQRVRRTKAEIDAEQQRRDRMSSRMAQMARAEGARARPALPPVPELKTHFLVDALRYDAQGRLWVRTERGGMHETLFNVFDAGGRFLGETRIPERMGSYAIGNGLLAGVVWDESDVEYIGVYRVGG